MGFWSLFKYICKMVKHRPDLFILIFTALFGIFRLWSGAKGSDNTRPAKPPKSIFKKDNYVKDIYSGNLMEQNIFLHLSEVSLVFFYAPWCRTSMLAAKQFSQTAQEMHNQISFIAVNCWWNKGDCRRTMKFLNYPQVLLYHPNSNHPIIYKGPHLSVYYNDFLKRALNPLVYLDTSDKVESYINNNQISIICFFDFSKSSITFRKYIETALIFLEQYPVLTINFGIILSRKLYSEYALKENQMNLYDSSVSILHPRSQFVLKRNTTTKAVIDWAKNCTVVLHKIVSCNYKSNALHRILKQGPTLMMFYINFDQLKALDDIAIRYHQQLEPKWPCCSSIDRTQYSVCMKDVRSLDYPQSCAMLTTLIEQFLSEQKPAFLPSNGGCGQFQPLYDSDRSRLEVCFIKSSIASKSNNVQNTSRTDIDGLVHRTNMTLQFLALDYHLVPSIADILGFQALPLGPPFTLILDLQNEQKFIMKMPFSTTNIERLILNYTNHAVAPTYFQYEVKSEEDNSKTESHVDINAVQAREFEAKVLASAKDVLVYYHTDWCGGCFACSDSLMNLCMNHPNLSKLVIYQVNERTNEQLPHAFKALAFPTIILYPGNRTSDSVVFSSSSCSLVDIVDFLLRYASPPTKAELVLNLCDLYRNDRSFQIPADICKRRDLIERLAR